MNLKDIVLSEISQSQKDKDCVIPLIRGTRIVKSIEMESRIAVTGSGGGGNVELLFNGFRVSAGKDEKVLEMDGGIDCTIMNVFIGTKLYTLKWLKWYILCYVYFTTI